MQRKHNETKEQKEERLKKKRKHQSETRNNETKDQKEERLKKDKENKSQKIDL